MIRRLPRICALAVAAVGLTAVAASGSLAVASVGPTKVGPHQYFNGLVNGKLQDAIVKVVCPGAANWGHALEHQTLSVISPNVITANSGYTGSRAREIGALIGPASSTAPMVVFTRYGHPQQFPTNIPVPCSGTGQVFFVPRPGSHDAKSGAVTVTWANVAAGG